MTDPAAPPAAPPAAAPAPVTPPGLEGSTAAAAIGKEANQAPGVDDWTEALQANSGMGMPTVVDDGGRLGSGHQYESRPAAAEPAAPAAPEPFVEAEQAPAAPAQEQSFVDRANAERERMYRTRSAAAEGQQLAQARAEIARMQAHQRDSLYTQEQINTAVREDPFQFLRERGVGLKELNERLESNGGKQQQQEPRSNSEVHALREQMQLQQRQMQQMQQQAQRYQQDQQHASALSSLAEGLTRYKDSYPGMHAVFNASTGTTPAEQVMIGLQRSAKAGTNMSADEVAGRLERVARQQWTNLQTAYGSTPSADNRLPNVQQTQASPLAAQTAGITNTVQSPTRVPRRAMSRAEEIAAAVSFLEYK